MFLNKQKYNESQCQEFIIYNFLKSKIDMDFEGGWYRKFSQKTEKMPLLLYTVLIIFPPSYMKSENIFPEGQQAYKYDYDMLLFLLFSQQ